MLKTNFFETQDNNLGAYFLISFPSEFCRHFPKSDNGTYPLPRKSFPYHLIDKISGGFLKTTTSELILERPTSLLGFIFSISSHEENK